MECTHNTKGFTNVISMTPPTIGEVYTGIITPFSCYPNVNEYCVSWYSI